MDPTETILGGIERKPGTIDDASALTHEDMRDAGWPRLPASRGTSGGSLRMDIH